MYAAVARGNSPVPLALHGSAFGTTYSVQVALPPPDLSRDELEAAVKAVLDRVDRHMSTYRSDSELEQFNQTLATSWFSVSDDTVRVARAALDIAERSHGAFDPTVGALVRSWGFGPGPLDRHLPTAADIATLHAASGFRKVEVRRTPPALRKRVSGLELDFSAIAKGFAVDEVATRLVALGAKNVLVNIGGELRGLGINTRGKPWLVAVEDPVPGGDGEPLRISLNNLAIATSGSYRKFRVDGERRLPHVIDPRTGVPVESNLIAVSVLATTAMEADGWSTALLVAGPDAGWALAQREKLAALFVQIQDGHIERRATPSFVRRANGLSEPEEQQR